MAWKLKLVEWDHNYSGKTIQVGDMIIDHNWKMFPVEDEEIYWPFRISRTQRLSSRFLNTTSRTRKPILVVLPDLVVFCVDGACFNDARGFYDGWHVSGSTADDLTVTPSIDVGGMYHGFITNGWIMDDVTGINYGPDGVRVGKIDRLLRDSERRK